MKLISYGTSYHAELCGAIRAIEIAYEKNWKHLWLKTDSSLVIKAIIASTQIPWGLRNIWANMKVLLTDIFQYEMEFWFGRLHLCFPFLIYFVVGGTFSYHQFGKKKNVVNLFS